MNPNPPQDDDQSVARGNHYVLPRSENILVPPRAAPGSNDAANLIRQKLARIYADEPNAEQEAYEVASEPVRSPHQQFMYDLSSSGKDLATVQTEWHNYYLSLPDAEKHKVWQEFYASNITRSPASPETPATPQITTPTLTEEQVLAPEATVDETQTVPTEALIYAEHKHGFAKSPKRRPSTAKLRDARSTQEVQRAIRDKVTAGGTLKAKHHIQSLAFGLGIGFLVVFIFLFGFFNEVFIAPFIQPGRVDAATPVIIGTSNLPVSSTPEVIIPKINVEIPVNYKETSTNESTIENDLKSGIVHYPTTVMPGQLGNAAFFGHSSNNILNSGKYKFAFVLLHTIVPGDTFYLTYQGKPYVYKVISRTIVNPNDVSVLNSVAGQKATATLITCDPPGTSLNRLVVVGQQISPDPSGNTVAPVVAHPLTVSPTLPGNGPTLLTSVLRTGLGKFIFAVTGIGIILFAARWINKPKHSSRE